MSRYDAMLAQLELLLNQRALLPDSRYCTLKQLREHDQQLLTAVNWLQQHKQSTAAAGQPHWLSWLLADCTQQLLPLGAVSHLCQPEHSWLLLHQLKQQLCNVITPYWHSLVQQQTDGVDAVQLWTLASYLQLSLDPFTSDTPLTAPALWYLALAKPVAAHQTLQQYRPVDDSQSILQQLALQLCMEGYLADIGSYPPQQLINTVMPQRFGLMILLAVADDNTQAKLINYLAQTDQAAAVAAMGYSGQLKFVPLLAELAQQEALQTAAADALAMLLGVLDGDMYLADPALLRNFHSSRSSSRHLSGATLTDIQLDAVWRSGNQQQRQLASCLRKIKATQQPLYAADRLQVRL